MYCRDIDQSVLMFMVRVQFSLGKMITMYFLFNNDSKYSNFTFLLTMRVCSCT